MRISIRKTTATGAAAPALLLQLRRRWRRADWRLWLLFFNWEDDDERSVDSSSASSTGKTTTAIGLSSVALEMERGG
jgi:hypothetical protein